MNGYGGWILSALLFGFVSGIFLGHVLGSPTVILTFPPDPPTCEDSTGFPV